MEYINTIQSSTILAISVPMAAPRIPIAGNPNKPKIKTAFAHTFTKREQAYTIVEMTTFSMLFIKFRYTMVNAEIG